LRTQARKNGKSRSPARNTPPPTATPTPPPARCVGDDWNWRNPTPDGGDRIRAAFARAQDGERRRLRGEGEICALKGVRKGVSNVPIPVVWTFSGCVWPRWRGQRFRMRFHKLASYPLPPPQKAAKPRLATDPPKVFLVSTTIHGTIQLLSFRRRRTFVPRCQTYESISAGTDPGCIVLPFLGVIVGSACQDSILPPT
jgi:hypothetical protein